MTHTSMTHWVVSALPSVQCPLPQALDHATARKHFNDVRKDMPHLSPAAARREAARRAGVDYNTFLKAWKKEGAVVRPPADPTPVPGGPVKPPVPPGTISITTREEARAFEKKIAKELGLKPGTAASRKAAADAAKMRYDDFLGVWKGQAPKIPVGDPIPAPTIAAPKPKPVPVEARPIPNVRSINSTLSKAGFRKSVETKVRTTHTGQVYGGGTSQTEGFVARPVGDTVFVTYHPGPGSSSISEVQAKIAAMKQALRDAGFDVSEGLSKLQFRVEQKAMTFSQTHAVKRLRTYSMERAELKMSPRIKTKAAGMGQKEALQTEIKNQMEYAGTAGDDLRGVGHMSDDIGSLEANNPNILAYYKPMQFSSHTDTLTGRIYIGDSALERGAHQHHLMMQANGWFSKCQQAATAETGDGIANTYAHEFGHFIQDTITGNINTKMVYREMASDIGATESEFFNFLYAKDARAEMPVLAAKVGRLVSRYGSSNGHEMFAEVWAEYTRNPTGCRPLVKKWGSMIQDILEGMQ